MYVDESGDIGLHNSPGRYFVVTGLVVHELRWKEYLVVIDKQGKDNSYDVFTIAWKILLQRFENTLSDRNFRGPANPDERGIVFPDRTDDKKLIRLLRRLRHYNPVPNQLDYGTRFRNLRISMIIEDPNFRDSTHSMYIQAADLAAYLLSQKLAPNGYMRKKSGYNYFDLLDSVLCKVASTKDKQGIVWL